MTKQHKVGQMFCKDTKEIRNYESCKTEYDLPNTYTFLDHLSLKSAIPNEWKKVVKKDPTDEQTYKHSDEILKKADTKVSKYAYEKLLSNQKSNDGLFPI